MSASRPPRYNLRSRQKQSETPIKKRSGKKRPKPSSSSSSALHPPPASGSFRRSGPDPPLASSSTSSSLSGRPTPSPPPWYLPPPAPATTGPPVSSPPSSPPDSIYSSSDANSSIGSVPNSHDTWLSTEYASLSTSSAGTPSEVVASSVAADWFYRPLPAGIQCEDIGQYRPYGYCPVDVGKGINDRYEIVHKVGWSPRCTVWLARDHETERYVVVKILSALDTEFDGYREVSMYLELQKRLGREDQRSVIVPLVDWCAVTSANGWHLVLIFEVAGPSLASFVNGSGDHDTMKLRPDYARKLARDAALGLQKLHRAGIVVGDVSAGNMVFKLPDGIHHWDTPELHDRLGHPVRVPLLARPKYESFARKHAPRHVYEAIDYSKNERWRFLEPQLRFIDLAEAGLDDKPVYAFTALYGDAGLRESAGGRNFSINSDDEQRRDQASDIYALGCIWYEMRTGEVLQDSRGRMRWRLIEYASWKERKLQRLDDVAASRAMAGRLYFTALRQLLRWLKKQYQNIKAATPCPRALYLQLGQRFVRCKCGQHGRLRLETDYDQEQYLKNLADTQKNAQLPLTLEQRIHNVGRIVQHGCWTAWHLLTVAQRAERLQRLRTAVEAALAIDNVRGFWYSRDQHNDDPRHAPAIPPANELDTGAPPPVKLGDEEARDFEDVLLMMLTISRDDRASLEEVLEMPWCDEGKRYEFENGNAIERQGEEEPWCQPYSRGPEEAGDGYRWRGKRWL